MAQDKIWQADDMGRIAAKLDWAAKDRKDAPKPVGTFRDDYEALCRLFEVPEHPCLASRTRKDLEKGKANDTLRDPIRFQNFVVDTMTVRLVVEALKRSSDVDTLSFHNASLTSESIGTLARGLPHTSIRRLRLDYNEPKTTCAPQRQSSGTDAESVRDTIEDNEDVTLQPPHGRFCALVDGDSKLRELLLRGNRIGDSEAIALANALEENTTLYSLNLFGNCITDVGAMALAKSLRLNTVVRGLSLAKNELTAQTARAFGLLLAGEYEVSPEDANKRAVVESKIAAQNKAAQDAMKKKRDAKVETRLPLPELSTRVSDGKLIAKGSASLAILNLSENRALGAGGALVDLLTTLADARKQRSEDTGSVALQELHLVRCQGYQEEHDEDSARLMTAAAFALRPTAVSL